MQHILNSGLLLAMLFSFGCSAGSKVFELLDADQTGIEFSNDLITNDTFNAIYFEYIYNGGGVAASDINNDGLTDLFFTGNQVSSRLYLNRGGFRFQDVTEKAGLVTDRWCTGVAVVDINGDGKKDIYISVAGYEVPAEQMENYLFINQGWDAQGVPQFAESAASYGLNDNGYSTQGAFLDYDKDGDLDLYLLTNALEKYNRNNLRVKRINGEAPSTDRLYRNNGDETFTNVSREAGILIEGYGLGVKVTDLNADNYPDVYAANDFLSNDLIWVNNGDGTFTNKAGEYLKHQTHNGMGVDIADFNNDALPDIAVLDMLPEGNYRQKIMIPNVNYDKFWMKRQLGYEDQYMRNTVQLHQGFTSDGDPRFSEIANLSGMAATDWSWAVLFADFDNDAWKDAYITNGYRKDVTNLDYVSYSAYNQMFGTEKARQREAIENLEQIPDVEVSNYLFHNKGDLRFENVTESWGLDKASFSSGVAYADLDNDGDLDLAVNNIDAEAFIFENKTDRRRDNNNYIQIELNEDNSLLTAYNAKVLVFAQGQLQYQEFSPFRGYKSTMEDRLHFGLGPVQIIDSILVIWPDGMETKLEQVPANQRLGISYEEEEKGPSDWNPGQRDKALFQPANELLDIAFRHADNTHSDLNTIRTLVHDHSKMGPALAAGDINGDGLDDFFVGGNRDQAAMCFIQNPDGGFRQQKFTLDSVCQDVDALLFDADGDGDQDLYVVSGGTSKNAGDAIYQDRLYLNTGAGNFLPAPNALPKIISSGSCVRASDYDQDGDQDLFVGGRILPAQYPSPPRSYLLENEGGKFVDVTPDKLREIGLVTDAVWTDFDGDLQDDLIVIGEWMPISFWENRDGVLLESAVEIDGETGHTNAWWMHLNASDIDQDGDIDLLLGNLGLNSKLTASRDEPLRLFTKDFDENGTPDPLLSCFIQSKPYLMHGRDRLISQIPGMKRRFPNYTSYAEASFEQVLTKEDLEGASVYNSYQFASIILENKDNEYFVSHQLPLECQFSPIMDSWFTDLDQDGMQDIVTAGNFQATETTQIGWYDASYGNLLRQSNLMHFVAEKALEYNLQADGDVRCIETVQMQNGQTLVLFGIYAGDLKAYLF